MFELVSDTPCKSTNNVYSWHANPNPKPRAPTTCFELSELYCNILTSMEEEKERRFSCFQFRVEKTNPLTGWRRHPLFKMQDLGFRVEGVGQQTSC